MKAFSCAVYALAIAALCLTGCHKNIPVYVPPPPPAASTPRASIPLPPQLSEAPQLSTGRRPDLVEVGLASWYGPPYHSRKGADGTIYDQNALTAAHKTLPLGSVVRVTNFATGSSVEVRITDRGPFVADRLIDLSLAAAQRIGVYRAGVAKVRVEAYVPPTKPGADPGGRWCVQVGAFLTAEDALVLKADLARRYATAKVTEFAGPTGYWVRINPKLPDKAHAGQIAATIHVPDAATFVVRTD